MGFINKDVIKRIRHNTNRLQQMKNKDYYIVILDDFRAKGDMDNKCPDSIVQWTPENCKKSGQSPLSLNIFKKEIITDSRSNTFTYLHRIMKYYGCEMAIYANTVGENMQDLVNALEKDQFPFEMKNKLKLISKIS